MSSSVRRSGAIRATLLAEQVLVLGHAHVVLAGHRHARRTAPARRRRTGRSQRVVQRVEERHRPDQVRGEPGQQQAALLERLADQRRSRTSPGSAGRRGSACSTATTVPQARSRCSTRPAVSPRVTASSAVPAPTTPPPTTSTSSSPRRGSEAVEASAVQRSFSGLRSEGAGLAHAAQCVRGRNPGQSAHHRREVRRRVAPGGRRGHERPDDRRRPGCDQVAGDRRRHLRRQPQPAGRGRTHH